MGKNHFKSLFKAEQKSNIVAIVWLAIFYPSFMDEEGNRDLFVEFND
jgi:hypothetical protein